MLDLYVVAVARSIASPRPPPAVSSGTPEIARNKGATPIGSLIFAIKVASLSRLTISAPRLLMS